MFKIKTQSLLEEAYCLLREIEKRKQAGRRDLDQYEIHIKKEIRRYNKAHSRKASSEPSSKMTELTDMFPLRNFRIN